MLRKQKQLAPALIGIINCINWRLTPINLRGFISGSSVTAVLDVSFMATWWSHWLPNTLSRQGPSGSTALRLIGVRLQLIYAALSAAHMLPRC